MNPLITKEEVAVLYVMIGMTMEKLMGVELSQNETMSIIMAHKIVSKLRDDFADRELDSDKLKEMQEEVLRDASQKLK